MLANRYYLLAAQWYAALDGHVSLRVGSERMLTPLPVNHMNAMAALLMEPADDGCRHIAAADEGNLHSLFFLLCLY